MACHGAGSYGYCEPTLVTFNTLISACAKAGKHQPALQVWWHSRRALHPSASDLHQASRLLDAL